MITAAAGGFRPGLALAGLRWDTGDTPAEIPLSAHVLLGSLLAVWALVLARNRRRWSWLGIPALAHVLVPFALLADALALVGIEARTAGGSSWLALLLLWFAWALSITACFALRTRGGGDDGDEPEPQDPAPPWWPDFERQFRHYARGRRPVRPEPSPSRRPRVPTGV